MKRITLTCLLGLLTSCANGGAVNIKELANKIEESRLDFVAQKSMAMRFGDFTDLEKITSETYVERPHILFDKNIHYYCVFYPTPEEVNEYFYDEDTSYLYVLTKTQGEYFGTKKRMDLDEALEYLANVETVKTGFHFMNLTFDILNQIIKTNNIELTSVEQYGDDIFEIYKGSTGEETYEFGLINDRLWFLENELIDGVTYDVATEDLINFSIGGNLSGVKLLTPIQIDERDGTNEMDKYEVIEIM